MKAKLAQMDTLRNTINGNPMYRCIFVTPDGDIIEAWTKPDNQFAYSLPNYVGSFQDWTLQEYRGKLRVIGSKLA